MWLLFGNFWRVRATFVSKIWSNWSRLVYDRSSSLCKVVHWCKTWAFTLSLSLSLYPNTCTVESTVLYLVAVTWFIVLTIFWLTYELNITTNTWLVDQGIFVFGTIGHCIKGKQCQHITIKNKNVFCSKQSSLFSFYALPSGGKSKGPFKKYPKL